ncbi:MAG TPA: extracellular solute-binding protein [Candidatus Binatia bacterium]|jgi:iron(III) transport system substrate-binding protein
MGKQRRWMHRWLVALVIAAVAFSYTVVVVRADDSLLSEARRERGIIRWYTALNVNGSKPLADAFEKKYPFLKVDITRLSNERIMNRIFAEAKSAAAQFDVTSFAYLPLLAQKNLLAAYQSPQTKAYLEGFFDPKSHWATMYSNLIVLGYNTRQVNAATAPQDWPDLLAPQWSEKIGMDPEVGIWYGAMLHYLGKEKGDKFFRSLAQQKIQWRRGHSLLAQLMTAGEFPLALVYAFNISQLQQSGAPVKWMTTARPVVATTSGIGISAKTDAPASSKLFVDFALSLEGQKVIMQTGRFSARKDLQTVADLKTYAVPEAVVLNLEKYLQEFTQLFRPT